MTAKHPFNSRLHDAAIIRGKRALALRNSGKTWEAVGKIMGITRQRAQQLAAKVTK